MNDHCAPRAFPRPFTDEGELVLPRRGIGTIRSSRERTTPAAGWWAGEYGKWRLVREQDAMRAYFPRFALVRHSAQVQLLAGVAAPSRRARAAQALSWVGRLHPFGNDRDGYLVQVTYGAGFPDVPPVVMIHEPLKPGTPHLLDWGMPCLYQPSDGPRHGYDPGRTTAATLVRWTALWLAAYEVWCATGAWPGAEHVPLDDAAWEESDDDDECSEDGQS
jgi:hypothetical protein